MSHPVDVIDLSHHNPEPDFAKVKASGVIGVIHKATENTGFTDPKRASRLAKARQAGLCISTYHFLRPGNIEAQMEFYLDTVQPVKGERVCLDYEDDAMPLSQLEACVTYLWSKRPDLQITVYSGHTIKEKLGNTRNGILAQTSLWIAQYTEASSPSWPMQTWPAWSLWQHTDKASVPGISQPVDGNKFNGTAENCVKWFGPVEEVDPVPPPAEPVIISIQTPPGLEIAVFINGREYEEGIG